MRKTAGFFLMVFLLLHNSCNESEQINKGNDDYLYLNKLEELIEIAGVEHNRALEYVYKAFQQAKDSGVLCKMSNNEIISFSQLQTKEFFLDSDVHFISSNRDRCMEFSDRFFNKIKRKPFVEKSADYFDILSLIEEQELNESQAKYLEVLNDAINSDYDLETLLEIFLDIKEHASLELTIEDSFIVLAAIDIGINSLTYWNSNLELWNELLGNSQKRWFSWRQVAAYDVAGAVGGAAATAITGGGIAAGIVGGAVGASVVCATVQIICHFGNCD